MIKGVIVLLFVIAYVGLGTYDLLNVKAPVTFYLDDLVDGLDIIMIPSNIIGGMSYWILGGLFGRSPFWIWLGQTINLGLLVWCFFTVLGIKWWNDNQASD